MNTKIKLEDFKEIPDNVKVEIINKLTDGKKNLTEITKEHFAFTNLNKYMPENAIWDKSKKMYTLFVSADELAKNAKEQFTEAEVLKLKSLLAALSEDNNHPQGETINRSVRVYKAAFEGFADWCKERGVKQSDAIYFALEQYMATNK